MLELRLSSYNVLANTRRDSHVLFNTLSKAAVEIPIDSYPKIVHSSGYQDVFHRLGFLVRPEDELARVKAHIAEENGSSDLSVIWHVTRHCNFACTYCYQVKDVSEMLVDVQDVFGWLLNICREHNTIVLTLFGGEPLLRPDRITDLLRRLRSSGINVVANIITNGWFLTPSVSEIMGSLGISRFHVTLDGQGPSHNARRPTARGEPTFDRVFENVVHALRWMEGTIRINWDRDNIDSLGGLVHSIASSVQDRSRVCLDFHHVFHDRRIANTSHVDDIYHQLAEPLELSTRFGLRVQNPLAARLCYGRRENAVVVDHGGRLFSCNITAEEPRLSLGTVSDPVIRGFGHAPEAGADCTSCCYFPVCGGGCIGAGDRYPGSGCRWNELENARKFMLPFCF